MNCLTSLVFLGIISSVYLLKDGKHFTNTWVVELETELSKEDADKLADSLGFVNHGRVLPGLNHHVFYHPTVSKRSITHQHEHTSRLSSHVHIRSAEQEVGRKRVKRDLIDELPMTFNDPMWTQMWYLNRHETNHTQYDLNVETAWRQGFTGKNVVVTIMDDGLEHTHPDLKNNYDPAASTDINSRDDDPIPRYDYTNENRHGTRCAGTVAAQADNDNCAVGVAYDSAIGGIRMLDGSVTDTVEAMSLSFNRSHIDIYCASWGPDDSGRVVEGPGLLTSKAFRDGVRLGRDGKGNIFVWASGNGGRQMDSCACDGYSNSKYTLSVSAVSEHNLPPWYQEQCSSILASTYSSGSAQEKKVVTTDLRHGCTTSHTGTSASAPIAAGLVAVMLQANPDLSWRDVQYVTILAANPQPLLTDGEFRVNGVGRKYSHKFGYGLMDLGEMVRIAQAWNGTSPQLSNQLPKTQRDIALNTPYTGSIEVSECSINDSECIRHLEHVELVLSMHSTKRGALSVRLTSPLGTESTLLPQRERDTLSAGFDNWTFMSVHFWGENPAGTWKLEITNPHHTGELKEYQLITYGVSEDPFPEETNLTRVELTNSSSTSASTTVQPPSTTPELSSPTNQTAIKRLAFKAQYTVSCDFLHDTGIKAIFENVLGYRAIGFQRTICKSECNMAVRDKFQYECENNLLHVTWYTEKEFPGSVTAVPDAWHCLLKVRLESEASRLASVVILDHYPPLVTPLQTSSGETVEVILTSG